MGLKQASCFFHPDRAAVAKCERCGRMICLEDKMTMRTYGGSDMADSVYTYCPICYREAQEASKKMAPIILLGCVGFAIISIAIFIIFFLFVGDMMSGIAGNFP